MTEKLPAWTANWWKPIESAPKDGTQILICRKGEDIGTGEIEITEWCVVEQSDLEPAPEFGDDVFRRTKKAPIEFWNGNGHRATHWMPLPPQPR